MLRWPQKIIENTDKITTRVLNFFSRILKGPKKKPVNMHRLIASCIWKKDPEKISTTISNAPKQTTTTSTIGIGPDSIARPYANLSINGRRHADGPYGPSIEYRNHYGGKSGIGIEGYPPTFSTIVEPKPKLKSRYDLLKKKK